MLVQKQTAHNWTLNCQQQQHKLLLHNILESEAVFNKKLSYR